MEELSVRDREILNKAERLITIPSEKDIPFAYDNFSLALRDECLKIRRKIFEKYLI